MQQRAILLLVATCLVACLAHPHHHAHIDEDLEEIEKGVDDVVDAEEQDNVVDAEEEEEATVKTISEVAGELDGLRKEGPLLIALDCGSSGTKSFLFASDVRDCPSLVDNGEGFLTCSKPFIKYVPTMSDLNMQEWLTAFAPRKGNPIDTLIHSTSDLFAHATQVKYIMAFATAGNRIIPSAQNMSAWTSFKNLVGRFDIDFVGEPATIPGTHEAFLEYLANGRQGFVSMGGASAQIGFVLDTTEKKRNWETVMTTLSTGGNALPRCNNQADPKDFVTAILESSSAYTPIPVDQVRAACEDVNCIGLVSWLGGPDIDGSSESCKTVTHSGNPCHRVSGNDRAQALMRLNADTNTHCHVTKDADKCVVAIEQFASADVTTAALKTFLKAVRSAGQSFTTYVIASLKLAISFYVGFGTPDETAAALGTQEGKFLFAAWGVHGFLAPLGLSSLHKDERKFHLASVATIVENRARDADWIKSQAAAAGYNVPCVPHFKPIDQQGEECVLNLRI